MAKPIGTLLLVGTCGALVASLALVGCGGSGAAGPGSGGTTGSGGSTGTAGTTGAGGSVGSGGATGTAGTTGAGGSTTTSSQLQCSPGVNPATGLLTGFTSGIDWTDASGKWGVAGNLQGAIYAYAGPNSGTWHAGVDTTAGILDIGVQPTGSTTTGPGTVAVADYAGGGMMFGECVNTSTWTGVSFTLGGTPAGCDVYFQVKTFADQAISNQGGCDAGCYSFPQVKVMPGDPVTVHFTEVTGSGHADAGSIPMQIVGLQWQLQSAAPPDGGVQAACTNAMLTIDNVMFVSN